MKHPKTKVLNLASTLRHVRVAIIEVECRACGHSAALDRAFLVRKHGADMTFARLRRMAAMGCECLVSGDMDGCGTRFPCLGTGTGEEP